MRTKPPSSFTSASRRWRSVQEAATLLGLEVVTLRRAIERNARRGPDGLVEAHVDGLRARKFARTWRVLLDDGWLAAESRKDA